MFQNSALSTATVGLPRSLPRTNTRTLRRLVNLVPLPRTWQEYLLWLLGMGVVVAVIMLQIWLSLQIAQAEQQLANLEQEYTAIEQENAELLWQIGQFTALDRIQIEATRLGYGPAIYRDYRQAPAEGDTAVPSSPHAMPGAGPFSLSSMTPAAEATLSPADWWQMSWTRIQTEWQKWVTGWLTWWTEQDLTQPSSAPPDPLTESDLE